MLPEAIPDPPGEWVGQALCGWLVQGGLDPEWWHPPARKVTDDNKEAMRLCMECDVRVDCLEYGLRWRMVGIWGGTVMRYRHDATVAERRGAARESVG